MGRLRLRGAGGVDAVVAIVGGAFARVPEDLVRGGNAGEALGGCWVGAVAVGVVAEGEGVELSIRAVSSAGNVT